MKKINLSIVLLFIMVLWYGSLNSQIKKYTPYDNIPSINSLEKPSYRDDYPDWGKMLYQYPVNYYTIVNKFELYLVQNPNVKNDIIRYFKIWKREVEPFVLFDGTIKIPDFKKLFEDDKTVLQKSSKSQKSVLVDNSNWTFWGPKETLYRNEGSNSNAGTTAPWQVNVYSLDVATTNNNILYCGTETGFVNKSIDNGLTWELCAPDYKFGGGITAIAIDPTNENIVYAAANGRIHKTIDGGVNWSASAFISVSKLVIDQNNPTKIFAASNIGVFVSNDAGANWAATHTNETWDIAIKPDNSSVIYGISVSAGDFVFVVSTDGGATFNPDPNFPNNLEESNGGLLAVTPDNPNIVYLSMLSKDSNAGTNFPLIYKGTNNSGIFTWTLLKQGYIRDGNSGLQGGEMSNGQGFYDFVLEVAPDNENIIFWGTTSFFKSTDGGINYTKIGGYGGSFAIHPDIQDIKALGNGKIWVSTDGGMNYSTDYFTNISNFTPSVQGLQGSDMWGFDQDWNDDVIVGGRYHNGNTALSDTYNNKALRLGGAESATGWIVHGRERQAAFNDINKDKTTSIPATISEVVANGKYSFTKLPNKVTNGQRRSNLLEHPNYHSVLFVGEGNGIWKSNDMGASWNLLNSFGSTVRFMEISHKNPDVMYVDVDGFGLYKTEDGGGTWVSKSAGLLSAGATSGWYGRLHFVISPYDENTVYLCTQKTASIPGKILKTTDGGNTWNDWSGTISTSKYTKVLAIQPTSTGQDLVYVFISANNSFSSSIGEVFYRKDGMADWDAHSNVSDYPTNMKLIYAQPFYRDGKIRVAGNNGVWESPLVEQDFTPPYITPWVDKPVFNDCSEEVHLDDHSIMNHNGITSWEWIVTPTPLSINNPNARNPIVVPGAPGLYNVTLNVTKNGQLYSKTINNMFEVTGCIPTVDCNAPEEQVSYQFDGNIENSGLQGSGANLALDSYTGNTGSVAYVTGNLGQAYNFDGTNTLITNEWIGIEGDAARTVTAWIKIPANDGLHHGIFNMGVASNSQRYTLKLNNESKLRIEINGGGFHGTTILPVNTWVHVAVTMPDGGNLGDNILYLNGEVEATSSSTTIINTIAANVLIGSQGGLSNPVFPFVGQIDDLRVYPCHLTKEQIVKIMNRQSLGINDVKVKNLKAFPVPTEGYVDIAVPSRSKLDYEVYSIQGQIVKKGVIKNAFRSHTFNLSLLPTGMYLIQMKDENGTKYRAKVIKK